MTFRFKDHKRRGQLCTQTLEAVEFLRRFCLHILPKGLHKIRYFGFMAHRHRQAKLDHCRTLLVPSADALTTNVMAAGESPLESSRENTRMEPDDVCPVCHQGRMRLVETYYRHQAASDLSIAAPALDTS